MICVRDVFIVAEIRGKEHTEDIVRALGPGEILLR
jgi:hypothetical protein